MKVEHFRWRPRQAELRVRLSWAFGNTCRCHPEMRYIPDFGRLRVARVWNEVIQHDEYLKDRLIANHEPRSTITQDEGPNSAKAMSARGRSLVTTLLREVR